MPIRCTEPERIGNVHILTETGIKGSLLNIGMRLQLRQPSLRQIRVPERVCFDSYELSRPLSTGFRLKDFDYFQPSPKAFCNET